MNFITKQFIFSVGVIYSFVLAHVHAKIQLCGYEAVEEIGPDNVFHLFFLKVTLPPIPQA